MLRAFFSLLSSPDGLRKGASLTQSSDADPSVTKESAIAEFKTVHAAVLLDDSLGVNLLHRITPSAMAELTHEARAALTCLARDARDGFAALMLQPVPFNRKFDGKGGQMKPLPCPTWRPLHLCNCCGLWTVTP